MSSTIPETNVAVPKIPKVSAPTIWISLGLIVATLLVYWPVFSFYQRGENT